MAARKLQNEIDKTLKKVQEGSETFNEIYEKMMDTTHQAQKEKLEADLKSQIKKLQRMRDQIKTWIASSEVKDKSPLLEKRREIEKHMERFKACEKEIKTKAFSKEGLIAQQRLDPHEKLKLETSQWVGGQVEELGRQMEATDAEVESLGTTTKKKSSKAAAAGAGRIAELEGLNERRKWHVHRLELILRLIENGNLDPDTVNDIREDIAYFVESNGEEDFEEDPGVYDELNLDAEEEAFGMVNDDMQSSHDSQSLADTSDIVTNATPSKPAAKDKAKAKKEESAAASSEAELPSATSTYAGEKSPTSARVAPVKGRKATLENKTGPPATTKASTTSATSSASASAQGNVASPASAAPQPRQAPVVLPPIRYSAAAAAAVAPSSSQSATSGAPPATSPPAPPATSTPGVLPTHSASVKVLPAQAQPSPATRSEGPPPGLESIKTPTAATTVPPAAGPSPSTSNASLANQQAGLPSATPSSSSPDLSLDATPSRVTSPKRDSVDMSVHSLPRQGLSRDATPAPSTFPQEGGSASQVPSSLQDLAESFERAKHKASRREGSEQVSQILDAGYSNVPQPTDAEKPRHYVPKNPISTAAWYPQQPLTALEAPELFSRYDVDTLFYIFYYHVGSYQQYLAAEELKRRAWRFHKQYLTWFQRAHEPQEITEEFEAGVYWYFDWETGWGTRKKNSFTFLYKFLEDE